MEKLSGLTGNQDMNNIIPQDIYPDTDDVFKQARNCITRSLIERFFPGGTWKKDEYLCLSPLRNDTTIGSFSIRSDGIYHDFSTGDKGDFIDLISRSHKIPKVDAAREIVRFTGKDTNNYQVDNRKDRRNPMLPVPQSAMRSLCKHLKSDFAIKEYGSFDDLWMYYNSVGQILFSVVRFQNDKKVIRPFYFDGNKWRCGHALDDARPLYNLPIVTKTPGAPVLIVEGEKAADAASGFLLGRSDIKAVTWSGGANAYAKTDFSPLANRIVYLWPDNDEPGVQAMKNIGEMLRTMASQVFWIAPRQNAQKGEDCADIDNDVFNTMINTAQAFDAKPIPEIKLHVQGNENHGIVSRIYEVMLQNLGEYPIIDYVWSDHKLSTALSHALGNTVFYTPALSDFFIFDGKIFQTDSRLSIMNHLYKQFVHIIESSLSTSSVDKKLNQRLLTIQNMSTTNAVINLLKSEPEKIVQAEEINSINDVICHPNGITNMRTMVTIPHDPTYHFTKMTTVAPEYSDNPDDLKSIQFLKQLCVQNPDVYPRLLTLLSTIITGRAPSLQKFPIFTGSGGSGKTQLIVLLHSILGDYSILCKPETFYQSFNGGDVPRSDLLDLIGRLLVVIPEPDHNARISTTLLKMLSGGDPLRHRRQHSKQSIEFMPRCLTVMTCNKIPEIHADDGISDRIEIYRFNEKIRGTDKEISDYGKFLFENDGPLFFGELIKTASRWLNIGGRQQNLPIAPTVQDWSSQFIFMNDTVSRFIQEHYISDMNPLTQAITIHREYNQWASLNGEQSMTTRSLGESLAELCIPSKRLTKGIFYYLRRNVTDNRSNV